MKTGVQWETYLDKSFFDMWVVRPVGDHDMDSPRLFHFDNESDAKALKALVEKSHHAVKV